MQNNILLITAILASPLLAAVVSNFFAKKKTNAESHLLNITGEVSLSDGWQKYAKKLEEIIEAQDKKITSMDVRIKSIEDSAIERQETHRKEIAEKNKRIATLESRVDDLEKELAIHKENQT